MANTANSMHNSTRRAFDAVQALADGSGNWHDIVDTARAFLGADGASFIRTDRQTLAVRTFEQLGHDESVSREYGEHYVAYDDSRRRCWEAAAGTWFHSSKDQRHESQNDRLFWADFMVPHGIHQLVGIVIDNGDELASLSVQRSRAAVATFTHAMQVEQYGRMLMQAYAARRAGAAASMDRFLDIMDPKREGYLVADRDGHVLLAMPGLEALLGAGSTVRMEGRRVMHDMPRWNARLLAAVRRTSTTGEAMHLILPDAWGRAWRLAIRPASAHFNLGLQGCVGIRIERRDVFDMPDASVFGELFGLSPAEIRLCRHLVSGLTVNDCSEVLGVSTNTLRKQLSAILTKTGCTRQTELIRLMSKL